jgi:hypothetical protein
MMRDYDTATNDRNNHENASAQDANARIALTLIVLLVMGLAGYIAFARFHIRPEQAVEACLYLLISGVMAYTRFR